MSRPWAQISSHTPRNLIGHQQGRGAIRPICMSHPNLPHEDTSMKSFASATMLTVFFGALIAPSAATEDDYEVCMADSGGVTVAMLDCIGTASDRAHIRMDAILDQHRPQLTREEAHAVNAAQRDWHSYRQSTCSTAATLWGDGSFAAVMQADCWLKLTLERLDWLQTVLARSD
jgi:uncharacterized protein YecT (DUF1311 family)